MRGEMGEDTFIRISKAALTYPSLKQHLCRRLALKRQACSAIVRLTVVFVKYDPTEPKLSEKEHVTIECTSVIRTVPNYPISPGLNMFSRSISKVVPAGCRPFP